MNWLPSFVIWPFAVAGLVAAAGPIIIHLLNRRRYRIVSWAAMEFLRQALERNRRILQIRDLVLLALRTLAVLLIGLALAQPFFSPSDETYDGTRPLHAVLVLDNSLSMGYESLEGTLLEQAKQRARQFIDRLPADSRVSLIPLCGSSSGSSPDAYTKEDALRALETIEVVDRSASFQRAVNEARKACESGPLLARRIVLLSDQQASNWADLAAESLLADLPPVQVVDVAAGEAENTWISGLRVQDGIADVETPATFIVELRHQGSGPRENLQVTLSVEDAEVASKTVTLEPGLGAREVAFEYNFNGYQPEPGQPVFVPVTATISPDRLPQDDRQTLVVPLVAALPVVFVDQYGADEENAVKNRLGETRHLRRLLAPLTSRKSAAQQLVKIRHVKLEQLDQDILADARLVVIAGLADPGARVALLREYVEQGGQLVIAAGGADDPSRNAGFDPGRWTAEAWLDGGGILPAPLLPEPLGTTPDQAGRELKPFFLKFDSLAGHAYFQLADVGRDELQDLYSEPFFFKAVQADLGPETIEALQQAEMQRLDEQSQQLPASAAQPQPPASAAAPAAGSNGASPARDGQLRWLLWAQATAPPEADALPVEPEARRAKLSELAAATQPRVLARFDDPAETPYLIERKIGRGTVLLVTSGLLSDWNTLPTTNAMLLYDRILRSLIQATLPPRNFSTGERITLPLPTADREVSLALLRPGQQAPESLDIGFIGREQLGFHVDRPLARGLYRVSAKSQAANGAATPAALWELALTASGDAAESELKPLSREEFEDRIKAGNVTWVGPGEEISLAGNQIRGQESWWWLILAVLILLLIELVLLGTAVRPAPKVELAANT